MSFARTRALVVNPDCCPSHAAMHAAICHKGTSRAGTALSLLTWSVCHLLDLHLDWRSRCLETAATGHHLDPEKSRKSITILHSSPLWLKQESCNGQMQHLLNSVWTERAQGADTNAEHHTTGEAKCVEEACNEYLHGVSLAAKAVGWAVLAHLGKVLWWWWTPPPYLPGSSATLRPTPN